MVFFLQKTHYSLRIFSPAPHFVDARSASTTPEIQATPNYCPCTCHCLEKRRRRFEAPSTRIYPNMPQSRITGNPELLSMHLSLPRETPEAPSTRIFPNMPHSRKQCKPPQAAVCIVFDCAACWGTYECWVPRNAFGVSRGSDKCMDSNSGLSVARGVVDALCASTSCRNVVK